MIVTISGAIGSGKSTVARKLAKLLDYSYFSVGALMREMAKEQGLSINELSNIAEKDKSIDIELDKRQKLLEKKDKIVLDSRLGFHFLPNSFKVYLDVDEKEAAQRIFNDNRGVENFSSEKKALLYIQKRASSESRRYKEYYGIRFPDKKVYDLVVDTTKSNPFEVAEKIASAFRKST